MVIKDNDLELINSSGWNFPPELWASLSNYEKSFAVIEFSGLRTASYYQERLNSIGFANRGRILDAACGMGQWSMALAELNNQVNGIDLMESRIAVADVISKTQAKNCKFQTGSIEKLPFPDQSFDGVFCYGAFMFTNTRQAMSEFSRVLKPKGRLYLNGNTWGWYAHLILDRGLKGRNYSLIRTALKMIARTLSGKSSQIVITESWLRKLLHDQNMSPLLIASEGEINLVTDQRDLPPPAYQKTFYGMRSIIELVAEKIK